MNEAQQLSRFMSCHPRQYKRKATGEVVLAVKGYTDDWFFEDWKAGDWIVFDQSRFMGHQLSRCPPKRFLIIYEEVS